MNNLVMGALAFAALMSIANQVTHAGPLSSLSREAAQSVRRKREIYPEISDEPEKFDEQPQVCVVGDLVYEQNEAVPADQPCLKCKCQPPGVHCEATRCEKKPGCRAIHKPNTCCPEYQCECDYEGKTYANGERLAQKPGTECKVCYCRGGEVQCAEVSCYIRNDCEGHKVPGKCCPKYDHCPPREPSSSYFANEINDANKTKSDDSHYMPDQQQQQQQNIEVMEPQNETDKISDDEPKITIQEIIPEIKEIPITSSPKREINPIVHGQLLDEHQAANELTTSGQAGNELVAGDTDSDSSELAEVYQQPPPVLRIGDKLLFLKKGELVPEKDASTPSTVITIIGAEGLQRGGVEESFENHEWNTSVSNKNESNKNDDLEHDDDIADDEDDMQTVAESTYIFSLVNRPSTSEAHRHDENTEDPSVVNATDLLFGLEDDEIDAFTDLDINFESNSTAEEKSMLSSTTVAAASKFATTQQPAAQHFSSTSASAGEKDEIIESNPEYPPLPDVMTQQVEESEHPHAASAAVDGHGGVAQMQPKILPEVFEQRRNSSNNSTANANWLKKTLLNPNASLPDSILASVAESDSTTTTDAETVAATQPTTSIITTTTTPAAVTETTSINPPPSSSTSARSIETMESIENTGDNSGENVTQTNDHASILNDEASNASVEDMEASPSPQSSDGAGTAELVEMLPGYENFTAELVEMPTPAAPTPELNNSGDVEMIDVDMLRGHTDKEARNATHEGSASQSAKEADDRKVEKRESSEDDAIFEELNREIGLETGAIADEKNKDEEEKEAKAIFKELLDEATSNTTPKPVSLQGSEPQTSAQRAQAQSLERIGDALSKFQLRDSKKSGGIDGNVLGILREFFTAQYRAYN